MAIANETPVPLFFAPTFESMDIPDAHSAEFSAFQGLAEYCLIEVPKDQLANLEAGQNLFFHSHLTSDGSDLACLCTDEKTFEIEFHENSNSLLLADCSGLNHEGKPLQDSDPTADPARSVVFAQCRGQLALKEVPADAQKVRDLILPNELSRESPSDQELVTLGDLQYQVAASTGELNKILDEGPYVEHDGAWRWLPSALEREILDIALSYVQGQGLDMDHVDVGQLLKEVQVLMGEGGDRAVPSVTVLLKALRSVIAKPSEMPGLAASSSSQAPAATASETAASIPTAQSSLPATVIDTTSSTEGSTRESHILALNASKVRLFQATQLLRKSPKDLRSQFNLQAPPPAKKQRLGVVATGLEAPIRFDEFLIVYKEVSCDELVTADSLEKLLASHAYVDTFDSTVHALDINALPHEPHLRLRRLFELQSHWKPNRIATLMTPALGNQKVEAWLVKTTRNAFIELEKGKEERMIVKKFAGLN